VKVSVDGLVDDASGVGMVQREVYRRLPEYGVEIEPLRTRDVGSGRLARLVGLIIGLLPRRLNTDAYLSAATPFPLWVPRPAVSFVYDLRWLRTRGTVSRRYRDWDLRRTVRKSHALLCISDRTASDLLEHMPSAGPKIRVVDLGPGQVSRIASAPSESAKVLLMGGARHKRNEEAAQALVASGATWFSTIVGVNVSPAVRQVLESHFGPGRCEWHERLSVPELLSVYGDIGYFMHLGVDEGFGLPYIEALRAGATVIAVDQPLTRSVLEDAAVLLQDGEVSDIAAQLSSIPEVSWTSRLRVASKYSWSATTEQVACALLSAVGR